MSKVVANKYQLGDCIGKGGFGAVYKALNIETGDFVAVKRIPLKRLPKEEVNSIKSEINLLKKLNHPNITKYVDHQVTKDELYIIMEFVENGSLQSVVKKFGKFPEPLVGLYTSQVLTGLAYLHDEGVIHRDIKGANILTTKTGVIKLADFGVAAKLSEIEAESVVGTPYWMAPEIIELNPPQYASDIWSLGCTVVELLEGNPPYYDLAPMAALFHIVQDEHPPLPNGISPVLKDFLLQCFQKDPNLRPNAQQLLRHKWIQSSRRKSSARTIDDDYATIKMHNKPQPDRVSFEELFATGLSAEEKATLPPRATGASSSGGRISPVRSPEPESQDRLSKYAERDETAVDDIDLDWGDGDLGGKETRSEPTMRRLSSVTTMNKSAASSRSSSGVPKEAATLTSPAASASTASVTTHGSSAGSNAHPAAGSSHAGSSTAEASKTVVGKKAAVVENMEDDFVLDDEEKGDDLQGKLKAKLKMKTIAPTDVRDPFYTSGGSSLAKYTEFGENPDFDEVEGDGFAEEEPNVDLGAILRSRQHHDGSVSTVHHEEHAKVGHDGDDVFAALEEPEADDDDPFASITSMDDLQSNSSMYEQLSEHVVKQIHHLSAEAASEESILESCAVLLRIFGEHPEQKHQLIAHHGIVPILELLDASTSPKILVALLKVVNNVIADDIRYKENLCLIGVLPAVLRFASRDYPVVVRFEASQFIREMCHTSNLTLQMFIACRGLPVLAQLMEHTKEEYPRLRNLVLSAIDCVMQVFSVQGRTPKNDFARVFVRSRLALFLTESLCRVADDSEGDLQYREAYIDKAVTILLLFSQGDHIVKSAMAVEAVLRNIFIVLDKLPLFAQIKLLKCIKNVSMDPNSLDPLQRTGFIQKLVKFLQAALAESQQPPELSKQASSGSLSARPQLKDRENSMSSVASTGSGARPSDTQNQVLVALYNLCRINKIRQEIAAEAGIIPCLMQLIQANSLLNQFALPMLCDLAHASKKCLGELWKNEGVVFYLKLLTRQNWQTNALDSIAAWITTDSVERKRVEVVMKLPENIQRLVQGFATKDFRAFAGLVNPMAKILTSSPLLSEALSRTEFVTITVRQLQSEHEDPQVRLRLLSILESMYSASKNPKRFIIEHHLLEIARSIAESDKKVMVKEQARSLVEAFESNQVL